MSQENSSCEFKNITTSMNCLKIFSADLDTISADIKKIKKKVREFFETTPILVDFEGCNIPNIEFLKSVVEIIKGEGFWVVGVKNIKDKYKNILKSERDVAVFPNSSPVKSGSSTQQVMVKLPEELDELMKKYTIRELLSIVNKFENPEINNEMSQEEIVSKYCRPSVNNKYIKDVVRKGQQVINKDGDIIILAPVNNGSEIISSGSVIITESTEGKIFAGVGFDGDGNNNAFIYIEKFNAHMVSINGIYKSFEVVDKELFNKRVLITLENEIIKIEPLE